MNQRDSITTRLFRLVSAGWLIGWYIKAQHLYWIYLDFVEYPIRHHGLFPHPCLDARMALTAYTLPLISLVTMWSRHRNMMVLTSVMMLLSSVGMLINANTFNDATWVTSFWVALWLLWLSVNEARTDATVRLEGTLIAQAMIGMIFLGGAVGKLTEQYWSGEAIYNIYFQQKTTWPYPFLREFLTDGQRLLLSLLIARGSIVIELFLALTPLMPARFSLIVASVIMASFVLFSHWMLYSVMGCLIALAVGCLYWNWNVAE